MPELTPLSGGGLGKFVVATGQRTNGQLNCEQTDGGGSDRQTDRLMPCHASTTLEAAPAGKSVPPYVGRPLPRRPPPAFTADLSHILQPWYGSGGRSQTIGAAGRLSG